MKAFICLLVLASTANAGILLGDHSGLGGAGGLGYSNGVGHVHGLGPGHAGSIVNVVHQQHHAPAAIVKVHHAHVEPAPQIVKVIHDHGHLGNNLISGPVAVVRHVQVIHGHDSGVLLHSGAHNSGHLHHVSHGWA